MFITIILFLLIRCYVIYALIDIKYCENGLDTIDKVEKRPDQFYFDVFFEEYYYARVNDSKSLACCAPKGSTIKWMFREQPLEKTNSTFRVLPGDHRYIQTNSITKYDLYATKDNNYFQCIVTNNNYHYKDPLTHIFVIYNHDGRRPTLNHVQSETKTYLRGKERRLRCSLFLGYDSKYEPFTTAHWISNSTKQFNETYLNSKDVKKAYIYRGGGEVNYITQLRITFDEDIWDENFVFKCIFKINGTKYFEHKYSVVPYKTPLDDLKNTFAITITSIATTLFFIIVLVFILFHFQIEIRVFFKDEFGKMEISAVDKKDKDVFVCYNFNKDSYCAHTIFINKTLVPYLEETLGYSCYDFVRDIKVGEYIPNTMLERMQKSRRLILILCDDLLKDELCQLVCQTAINEALKRKLPIICILPNKSEKEEVISNKEKLSTSMQTVLNVAHKVTWPGKNTSRRQYKDFWTRLRLRLPPRRQFYSYKAIPTTVEV